MDEEDQQQQQQQVVDDPYGFIVEQCIIPSAEENHLRSMPLFSPPIPQPQPQPQPSPPPVASTVKHENTDDIEVIIPSLEKETGKEEKEEAATNMEVDESQRVTKEPIISVENEAFLQQSPPPMKSRDEVVADDETHPSPVIGELQKTTEEEEPPHASLRSNLEQNEVLAQSQTPKIQTGQTHFVPARFQPADAGVGVGPSSSSSNPRNPKEGGGGGGGDNTTIDILDVLRNKGFNIPRPRWWRPEGYNVKD